MPELEMNALVSIAGLIGGVVLGLGARMAHFCVMGAVEDAAYGGSLDRLRMITLAAAVAVAGTALARAGGAFDPYESFYLSVAWSPVSAILGGLIFGVGMAFVGTCGFGALARIGGGDIRSLIMVMVIGVAAYATLTGPLAGLRILLGSEGAAPQSLADHAGTVLGIAPLWPALGAAAVLGAVALWPGARPPGRLIAWGAAMGLVIPAAWVVTSHAAAEAFDVIAVEAFNFVTPLGQTLVYLMTSHDVPAPGFSVSAVLGVVAGSALGSAFRREFRWEACDDPRELRRQLAGAVMMGVGGVLALGCTIGQGLSALSVLTPSAPVVVVAILVGARIGLHLLVEGVTLRAR